MKAFFTLFFPTSSTCIGLYWIIISVCIYRPLAQHIFSSSSQAVIIVLESHSHFNEDVSYKWIFFSLHHTCASVPVKNAMNRFIRLLFVRDDFLYWGVELLYRSHSSNLGCRNVASIIYVYIQCNVCLMHRFAGRANSNWTCDFNLKPIE